MTMTKDEIQGDRAAIASASPVSEKWGGIYGEGPAGVLMATGPMVVGVDQAERDAEFIRRARDRWVLALEEIERLRAER